MNLKTTLGACALFASLGSAHAAPFTLNLEGITASYPSVDSATIGGFYNGGTSSEGSSGVNYGVDFVGDIQTTCLNSTTVFCSSTSKAGTGVAGSGRTAMTAGFGSWLNVAAGFDTAFSFAYAQPLAFVDTTVNVYSGLDGSGDLLGSLVLDVTSDPSLVCEAYGQAGHCPFYNAAISFAGVARSVAFDGFAGLAVYDDLTFGSSVVGAGSGEAPEAEVPEPSALSLLAAAGVLGALARRRRRA